MTPTDAQVDAAYSALSGGTPIFEIVEMIDAEITPVEMRTALVEKYGGEVIAEIIREKVQPNMGPGRRLGIMIKRVIKNNPDKVEEIKISLKNILDTL